LPGAPRSARALALAVGACERVVARRYRGEERVLGV